MWKFLDLVYGWTCHAQIPHVTFIFAGHAVSAIRTLIFFSLRELGLSSGSSPFILGSLARYISSDRQGGTNDINTCIRIPYAHHHETNCERFELFPKPLTYDLDWTYRYDQDCTYSIHKTGGQLVVIHMATALHVLMQVGDLIYGVWVDSTKLKIRHSYWTPASNLIHNQLTHKVHWFFSNNPERA